MSKEIIFREDSGKGDASLEKVVSALQSMWSADTAYDKNDWRSSNPARGQCVVSALIIQDYFGGELQRYKVTGEVDETHYANLLEGDILIDVTFSQYSGLNIRLLPTDADLNGLNSLREKLLSGGDTERRYNVLKAGVNAFLTK